MMRVRHIAALGLISIAAAVSFPNALLAKSWWETSCSHDPFYDKDHCVVRLINAGPLIIIGLDDAGQFLLFGATSAEATSPADEIKGPFVARIDSNPPINLMEGGQLSSSREMLRVRLKDETIARQLVSQLLGGKLLRVRVGEIDGYGDIEIGLGGFRAAWEEFARNSAIAWVRASVASPAAPEAPAAPKAPKPTATPE